jgi:transposase InsO family protein
MNREVHVRFWESAGLQCLALLAYLRAYGSVGDARVSIGRYLEFYNCGRPHSSLDRRTPDEAYFDQTPQKAAA